MLLTRRATSTLLTIIACTIGLTCNSLHALQAVEISKGKFDKRVYKGLILDNGLKVVLVSDPEAETAGVALNVEVGMYNEPNDRLGLAHFLEHMLFLGTKKYPDPNEYGKYIDEHGGFSNAWTSARNTQYYYSILPQYLEPSLDRFAQFFIEPLFTAQLVDRERHAVDSEYLLRIKNDSVRFGRVDDITANPLHPIVRFSIGNLKTLGDSPKQRPVREELIEFYNNYYSSDRMALVIVAPQTIEEQQKIVTELFNKVPQKSVRDNKLSQLAYTSKETAKKISMQSLGDYQELTLRFPIPSQKDNYTKKSIAYILYMLQQTDKGGLYQFLKSKNLITELSAYSSPITTNQDVADINLSLTPYGLNHTDEIVQYVFDYIAFLQATKPQLSIFNELRAASIRNFDHAEKIDPASYATMLPGQLHLYPLPEVLSATTFTPQTIFDADDIENLLKYFTPKNLRLFEVNPKVKGNKKDPYYFFNYKVADISSDNLKKWSNTKDLAMFTLPSENIFIPENLLIKNQPAGMPNESAPEDIVKEPGVKLWFKQDNTFNLPNINLMFLLETPDMQSSARRAVAGSFFNYGLDDHLSYLKSKFLIAGVGVSQAVTVRGFELSVGMYGDKQKEVMQELMRNISEFKINPDRFAIYKDNIKRDLQNFKRLDPFYQAFEIEKSLILQPQWLPEQMLTEIDNLTVQEVQQYIDDFKQQMQISALFMGNIAQKESVELIQNIAKILPVNTSRTSNPTLPKVILLKDGSQQYYKFNPHHDDSVVVSYYQANQTDDKTIAANALLNNIISRPAFDTLRTKEQLGYVVGVSNNRLLSQPGSIFYLESPKHKPEYIQLRLTAFLNAFKNDLANLSAEEFENNKSSLQALLLQKPNSLSEETAKYWGKIIDQSLRFNFEKDIAAEVAKLQLIDLVKLYDSMWLDSKSKRTIAIISEQKGKFAADYNLINSMQAFKEGSTYIEYNKG